MTFWRTAEERDAYASREIHGYLDADVWFQEVEDVFAGVVTHVTRKANVQRPTGKIDEDGYDEAGEGPWEDKDDICFDYQLQPLEQP